MGFRRRGGEWAPGWAPGIGRRGLGAGDRTPGREAERKGGRDGRTGLEEPEKVRPDRSSARQGSVRSHPPVSQRTVPSSPSPPEFLPGRVAPRQSLSVPSRSRPDRSSVRRGFVRSTLPGQPKDRSIKVRPVRSSSPERSHHPFSFPFLPSISSSTPPAPLTPPAPRPSILRSGAAGPQGLRFDRRGWNRPSQGVERDFGCGAGSCRRVGGSVAEASG